MTSAYSTHRNRNVGVLLVLTSTVAFAIGPTAAKIALDNGSNTLTVVTLRGIIGAALLGLLIVIFRQSFLISRVALRWCLLCSGFSALMVYGFIGSVSYIPIGVAVLIFFVHPIAGHSPLARRRSIDRQKAPLGVRSTWRSCIGAGPHV